MKQKVIEFFQNLPVEKHEQFNEAFKLYRESPNKNALAERSYNSSGYTERSLENLMYDLQKLHDVSDVEKITRLQIADSSKQLGDGGDEEGSLKLDPNSEVPGTQEQISTELNADSTEALKLENEDLKSENEDLQFEKEGLEEEVEDLKNEVETLKLAPKLDAKQIRVEFPFLNEKDCPDEFKILVADKITAWNKYLHCHDLLSRIESGDLVFTDEEKVFIAQEAVESFAENQKIYNELNCYQTTGKILGVHPIFKKIQLTREIETMTNDELIKYKASSAKYFSVKKGALTKAKKAKDEAKIAEIEAGVAERHDKLFLVNKKLGV